MNSVSWFIYVAQVADDIKGIATFLGVTTLLICGFYGIIATIVKSATEDDFRPTLPKARYIALGFGALLLAALMPSKNTMYAIAASQVGEQVVNNEEVRGTANDATKALRQWIRKQIDPDKPEKK